MSITKTIKGEAYDLIIMQVIERDELGHPLVVKLWLDDRKKVNIKREEEFITAFVHRDGCAPTVKAGKA